MPFAANPAGEPLTVTTDPRLLNDVHQRLMAFHKAAFQKVGINASTVPSMTTIALGVWTSDRYARGLTNPASANLHWQMKSASCPAEPCLATYTPQTYNKLIVRPTPTITSTSPTTIIRGRAMIMCRAAGRSRV